MFENAIIQSLAMNFSWITNPHELCIVQAMTQNSWRLVMRLSTTGTTVSDYELDVRVINEIFIEKF